MTVPRGALSAMKQSAPYVEVDYEDDPVPCPECHQETRKGVGCDKPTVSLSSLKTVEASSAVGKAYCENPNCSLSSRDEFITWSYRYG